MEQDRSPAVLSHHHELARHTAASHQAVVNLIGAVTTTTGLRVHAELDERQYPTGIRISNAEMDALPIHRHDWHGQLNYTCAPRRHTRHQLS